MKNLQISTRLAGAFILLTALLLGLAATAWLQMSTIQARTIDITTNWLPSVEHINQMNTATSDFRVAEMEHVMNTEDKAMAAAEQAMTKVLTDFEHDRQTYVKLISSDEERTLYETMAADWTQYLLVHDQLIALSRKNENQQAKQLLDGESKKLIDKVSDELDKLADLNSQGAKTASELSEAAYARARNILFGSSLAAVLLAITLAIWLIRSITQPLNRAVAAADRVASGDLSTPIQAHSHDETGRVLMSLQRMQESLAKTVLNVRENAEGVSTASSEIAQGTLDLSQRTEEQASALEETAASMEQLSATVRQNADSARQASQLAIGASDVASKGGEVVAQVVDTMKQINHSSSRIADIISVIDGIAFQTNILALNAAVEAARAGEQGRGFAVVASEVRTLAQRSANAAKEIKGLITASVEQVEAGTQLVDRAGSTMGEIMQSIRRVNDIVGEISSASTEQAAGVAQVGEAVTQLDQTTQQNAALVEESSAAAESLRTQARQLVDTVAVFKLGTEPAAATLAALAVPTAPPAAIERRGPNRATNVVRPKFVRKTEPAVAPAPTEGAERARTGTDDNWESF